MGLFSRKDTDPLDGQQGRARASVSSEAQAAQWRARARRRLVGAVALVLAAVIVLPMVLDSEPVLVPGDIPIVIPDRSLAHAPQFATEPPVVAEPSAPLLPPAVATTTETGTEVNTGENTSASTTPSRATRAEVQPPRTDDGSHARALLEGRVSAETPRMADTASSNAYVLQIAAYGSRPDAVARRDKLRSAGQDNVFVEEAIVNDKSQYRLRVGPFSTREAAQAAQARLRALGYDNGFIAAQ